MYNSIMKKLNFNMEDIKLFDSFAGIGALHTSLKELGVPTKLTGISEIDIDAIISYGGIHINNLENYDFNYPSDEEMREWLMNRNIGFDFKTNKSKIPRLKKDKLKLCYKASILTNNYGDISIIDPNILPGFDLFNFSFPCTDISIAGNQKGMIDKNGDKTRSGLYVDGIRIIKAKKPKYIMIENVKNLISKKFINDFEGIINELKEIGYNTYVLTNDKGKYQCLNAKNYGIPQNRERVFVIGIRKDIDTYNFEFPIGKDYDIRLKDILEDTVDEKYYLNEKYHERFVNSLNSKILQNKIPKTGVYEVVDTTVNPLAKGTNSRHWVYNTDKIISTKERKFIEFTENGVEIRQATKTGYDIANEYDSINLEQPNSKTRRGRVGKQISQTLTTSCNQGVCLREYDNFRIRKLTPKECWRLMGFRDEYFEKAKELGISDSQLYKQAGNSIVVNVLYFIFKNLFKKYIIK